MNDKIGLSTLMALLVAGNVLTKKKAMTLLNTAGINLLRGVPSTQDFDELVKQFKENL
jgi:hypothetical protein